MRVRSFASLEKISVSAVTLVTETNLNEKPHSYSRRFPQETSRCHHGKMLVPNYLLKNNEMAPFLTAHVPGGFSYLYALVRVPC